MELNPVYLQYFTSRKRINNELHEVIYKLVNIVTPGTYVQLKSIVNAFSLKMKERPKFVNDLRRLSIIILYDKNFNKIPIPVMITNYDSYYVGINNVIKKDYIMRDEWKLYVFKLFATNNIIMYQFINNYLVYYIEVPINDAYQKLIDITKKTLSDIFQKLNYNRNKINKKINRILNQMKENRFKSHFLKPLQILTDGIIDLSTRNDNIKVIVNTSELKRIIKVKMRIELKDFVNALVRAYIQALRELELYESWKNGGLVYISLLKVYEKFKETEFGDIIKNYEEFVDMVQRITNMIDEIKISVHPRYIRSIDRGLSIYISQLLF